MRLLLVLCLLVCWVAFPSDADLENAIRARFARSKGAAKSFQVKVKNGVATIEGQADIVQHKAAATRMAKSAGATRVINNVQLSAAARQKAASSLPTARRATVKRAP